MELAEAWDSGEPPFSGRRTLRKLTSTKGRSLRQSSMPSAEYSAWRPLVVGHGLAIMVAPTERYGQMARYTRALVFPSIRTALTTLIDAKSFPSFELFAALGDCLEKDHLGQLVEQMDHGLNNRIGQYLYGVLHLTSRPKALYKARPELLKPDLHKARNEEYAWLARHAEWRLVRGELVKFAKQVAEELSKRSPDEALKKTHPGVLVSTYA